jgi:hypothetical protein
MALPFFLFSFGLALGDHRSQEIREGALVPVFSTISGRCTTSGGQPIFLPIAVVESLNEGMLA